MGFFNTACFVGGSAVLVIGVMGGIEVGSNTPPSPEDDGAGAGGVPGFASTPPDSHAFTGPGWNPDNIPFGTGETPWMDAAGNYLGTRETGNNRGTLIDQWNLANGGRLGDPWCATFVNHALGQSGVQGTGSASSQSFRNWGVDAGGPVTGSIVVFKWPNQPGGHVGFVQSVNANGTINVLGGNQSNSVSVATFSTAHVVGYRLPPGSVGGGINTGGTSTTPGGGYNETR
jgi:uncharacterized protein (TIGR02594 family)